MIDGGLTTKIQLQLLATKSTVPIVSAKMGNRFARYIRSEVGFVDGELDVMKQNYGTSRITIAAFLLPARQGPPSTWPDSPSSAIDPIIAGHTTRVASHFRNPMSLTITDLAACISSGSSRYVRGHLL